MQEKCVAHVSFMTTASGAVMESAITKVSRYCLGEQRVLTTPRSLQLQRNEAVNDVYGL